NDHETTTEVVVVTTTVVATTGEANTVGDVGTGPDASAEVHATTDTTSGPGATTVSSGDDTAGGGVTGATAGGTASDDTNGAPVDTATSTDKSNAGQVGSAQDVTQTNTSGTPGAPRGPPTWELTLASPSQVTISAEGGNAIVTVNGVAQSQAANAMTIVGSSG